jgi:hypothetical protein
VFFEEPLHYTDPWGYAELCKGTTVPIAGGECLTGAAEWRTFIDMDCFDIGQPDASFTGGLTVVVEVAEHARRAQPQHRHPRLGRGRLPHAERPRRLRLPQHHASSKCPRTTARCTARWCAIPSRCATAASSCRPRRRASASCSSEDTKARYPFKPGSGEFNERARQEPREAMDDQTQPMTKILIDIPIHQPGLATLSSALPNVDVAICRPHHADESGRAPGGGTPRRYREILFCADHPGRTSTP